MIGSRLIKSNDVAAGCEDIVDNYDPFGDSSGLALYQLNGNANDESGVNNGFSVTGVTWGSPGVFGTAASFPGGTSAKIGIPDIINSHSTTISAWVKGSGYWCTPQKEIYAPLGTSSLYWGASGTSTSLTGVEDGGWHHIAVCATSARTVDYYVDGVQVAHNVSATDFPQDYNYSDNWIGHFYHPSTPQSFNGLIDQFRIFNRGLTPLEIEALYTEELCICGGTVDTLDILDDSSCIALYPLDGNANDLSGNYPGTPTDVSYGVGTFDLSAVFNTGAIITTNLNTGPQDVNTYSFWFKSSNTQSGGYMWLLYKNTSGVTYNIRNIYAVVDSQDIRIEAWGGSGNRMIVPFNWNDNNWHNLVVTFDYPKRDVYIDGSLVATQSTAEGTGTVYGNINFGSIPGNTTVTLAYPHELDQVRIFNKALSAGEVTTLYNETACTPNANPEPVLYLSSYDSASYPGSGSTWFDISGNNYHGSIGAGVSWTGSAFSFNDSANSVVTNYNSVITGNAQRSMEFYATWNDTADGGIVGGLGNMGNGSLGSSWSFTPLGTLDGSALLGGGAAADEVFTTNITRSSSSFQHIIVTWNAQDRGTLNLYVNGTLVETILRGTGESYTTVNGYTLGWWGLQNAYWKFNGNIKLFRIYDIALSGSQVASAYTEVISM